MNVFQQLGLLFIAVVLVRVLISVARGTVRKRVALMWLSVWGGGALALVRPSLMVTAARSLGIGRGADLLLYCWVFATTWGFFWSYTKWRRMERQMTLLVRELAIASPRLPATAGAEQQSDPEVTK